MRCGGPDPTVAFDLRVTPEELSALPARLAAKAGFARALAGDLQHRNRGVGGGVNNTHATA